MAAKFSIGSIPLPIFGNVSFLARWSTHNGRLLRPAAPWALPVVAGALWFIWPAVDRDWKIEWGFIRVPKPTPPAAPEVKLDAAGKKAAENAFQAGHEEHAPSEKEIQIMKEARKGEFGTLEKDWDTFLAKAIKPGEDDDDDDEDDEEEEAEEEEEEVAEEEEEKEEVTEEDEE